MKRFSTLFIYTFLALGMAWSLTSCNKYVEGFESDPNNATDGPIDAIARGAQLGLILSLEGEDARAACIWSQQFTGIDRQYSSLDVYTTTAADYDWATDYYTTIQQANVVIQKAKISNNQKLEGMMLVIKAQMFGHLTALYGDIPFTQANQFPAVKTPIYDNQTTVVYPGIQAMLDEGIAKLNGPGGIPAAGDLFFAGNAARWIAVANTLKARYFLHVGNYDAAITAAGSGISAAANDMQVIHGTEYNGNMNLWHSFLAEDRPGYMDASVSVLRTLLTNETDGGKTVETARSAAMFTGADLNVSATGMFAPDATYPLVTYIENQLIIAEAQMRKATPDKAAALTALNNVRTALRAKYPTGTYTAFVDADFTTNALLIAEIMEERYMSLAAQVEVFNDMRRNVSGKVAITPKGGNASIPQRFFYPQNEVSTNPNTPRQAGTDLFAATRVNGGTK